MIANHGSTQLVALILGALLLVASVVFLIAHILSVIWFGFSLGQLINYIQILFFVHAIYSCRPNYLLTASRTTQMRIILLSAMFIFSEATRLFVKYRELAPEVDGWLSVVDIVHAFTSVGISILLICVVIFHTFSQNLEQGPQGG